jgi:hypothetical protein
MMYYVLHHIVCPPRVPPRRPPALPPKVTGGGELTGSLISGSPNELPVAQTPGEEWTREDEREREMGKGRVRAGGTPALPEQ